VALSDVDAARFVRQVLLPEIGASGQARIGAATAPVGGSGAAHDVAARYARGAGFAAVADGPLDRAALAPIDACANDAARDVLAGARAALAAIRAAVGSA
jgi:hypothetical protein